MSSQKKQSGLSALRKSCRKKMIDLGYGQGAIKILAGELGVNAHSLTMALTGYRDTPRSIEILMKLKSFLDSGASQCVNIHNKKQTSN